MTDILTMYINQRINQLKNNILDLQLAQIMKLQQTRISIIVHNKITSFLTIIQVHYMISYNIWMI